MKQETAEDMLDFAKEVCLKYSRVKTLAEETQVQWRQDLEMAADSKYPGEKEMYDRQAEEGLARSGLSWLMQRRFGSETVRHRSL